LVREQPGPEALLSLLAYGLGTAIPLLLIGYGGQWAVHSVRSLCKYTGRIKQFAGGILIVTAIAFQFGWFKAFEALLVSTPIGNIGIELEEKYLPSYDGAP
jgi:sulfite exporter TauE/SafE|tara:strand:+ start:751 stop:1053 length:303 start_codon:yes stop_codon:yes gene_type:complete